MAWKMSDGPQNPATKGMSSVEIGQARASGKDVDHYINPDYKYAGYIAGNGGYQGVSVSQLPAAVQSAAASAPAVTVPSAAALPSSIDSLQSMLQSIAQSNNDWSAAQAQKQMDFQRQSAKEAMEFNADQAALSRKWQEYMSNTAHQREVKDLMAAGLNPVLATNNGAPVTTGATASGYAQSGAKGDTDTSANSSLVSILGSMLSAQTQLASTALSARTQEAVADKYTAMEELVANIQSQTQYGVAAVQRGTTLDQANINALAQETVAKIHAGATVSSAQISAEAAKVAAALNRTAQVYGYNLQAQTQKDLANWNQKFNKELKELDFGYDLALDVARADNEIRIRTETPSSYAGIIASGVHSVFDALSDAFPALSPSKYMDKYSDYR